MFYETLSKASKERCPYFGHKMEDWTPELWAVAVAGETGEMCNLVKKKIRGDDVALADIGKEAADIVIYLDLFCQRMGIDLRAAVIDKFNEVSDRIHAPVILSETAQII